VRLGIRSQIRMERRMPLPKTRKQGDAGPKKRPRHHSYDESVDEPANPLEQEAVEIEKRNSRRRHQGDRKIEQPDDDGVAFEE